MLGHPQRQRLRRPSHDFGEAKRVGALPGKLASKVTAGDRHGSMRFKTERGRVTCALYNPHYRDLAI